MSFLAGFITPQDFGAGGTGTTDDTAALQAAINAANAAGGAVVYVPEGTYNFTSLAWRSFAYLLGAGPNATVLQCTSPTGGITGTSVEYAGMRQLQVNGPGSGVGSGIGINLAWTTARPNAFLSFEDLLVESFGGHQIKIQNPIVTGFKNVVTGGAGRGFWLTGVPGGAAGTSVSMDSCYAVGCGAEGYYLSTLTYSALNGCASDTNEIGYALAGCQGVTLNGCGAEGTLTGGSLDGSSFKIEDDTAGSHCYAVKLDSCWSYNNDAVAFNIGANQHSVTLIGPTENTPLGGATASVQTGAGSSVTILGESVTTAMNLASGTTTILQDGAGDATIAGALTAGGNITTLGTLQLTGGATIKFGSALDTDLYRLGANSLATDGLFTAYGGVSSGAAITSPQLISSLTGGGRISQGSGAPSKPNGANPAAGDIYFRTDTPTTANQRLYVCTTGGASPVWSGIA